MERNCNTALNNSKIISKQFWNNSSGVDYWCMNNKNFAFINVHLSQIVEIAIESVKNVFKTCIVNLHILHKLQIL